MLGLAHGQGVEELEFLLLGEVLIQVRQDRGGPVLHLARWFGGRGHLLPAVKRLRLLRRALLGLGVHPGSCR